MEIEIVSDARPRQTHESCSLCLGTLPFRCVFVGCFPSSFCIIFSPFFFVQVYGYSDSESAATLGNKLNGSHTHTRCPKGGGNTAPMGAVTPDKEGTVQYIGAREVYVRCA